MDLSTTYMGLKLRNPIVPSASPLSEHLDTIQRMAEAGASAVVLYSLFEEQLSRERLELDYAMSQGTDSFAEALSFFPEPDEYKLGPDEYLNHIQKAKKLVDIPIIPSLNGSSLGGWTEFAKRFQEAGADAIELNIYSIPTDPKVTSQEIEQRYIDIVKAVKSQVTIPVAVKLSPFFSNTANMAVRLAAAGADALVLFNRFYQPDINLETLEVEPKLQLSTGFDLRLPMTWIGILYGKVKADLAGTRGVYSGTDVIKLIMAGANVAMVCSSLLREGVGHIRAIERGMREWMEKHEYSSVKQMRGSMSQAKIADPSSFERAQYMKALTNWRPEILSK